MLEIFIIWLHFFTAPTPERVYNECIRQGIKYPEIVTKQAILETGHFKSYNCTHRNNLFGLWNSHTHEYYTAWTWRQSIKQYKDSVQIKYKGGDYYLFLQEIGYATDKNYIKKVKSIRLFKN